MIALLFAGCAAVDGVRPSSQDALGSISSQETYLAELPAEQPFPEIEAQEAAVAQAFETSLSNRSTQYKVLRVVSLASGWQYVRHQISSAVTRRKAQLGFAVQDPRNTKVCRYVEKSAYQERIGRRGWGPIVVGGSVRSSGRIDCRLLSTEIASR